MGVLSSIHFRRKYFTDYTKELIETISIDDFIKSSPYNFVGFIKVDVEGHELSVIRGAINSLMASKIGIIQFECGGTWVDSGITFNDFYAIVPENYKICDFIGGCFVPVDCRGLNVFDGFFNNYYIINSKILKEFSDD